MPAKRQNSSDKTTFSGNGWMAGMIVGQLLGFAAAISFKGSVPTMLVLVLVGSIMGGILGASLQKPKKVVVPLRDKNIRAHVFEALAETSKKLDEVIIDEQFNGAAGSETDRRAMKQQVAQPKLAIPMPLPPKMGGM